MSDTTDSPTVETEQESFFEVADGGVGEQEDTTQQAEPEPEQPQDSPEAEAAGPEGEGDEVAGIEQEDSQPEEKPAKDDPDAFQFWESKYHKAEAKFQELGVKPEEIPDEYVDLVKVFHSNPEKLQEFAEFMSGGNGKQPESDSQPEESKTELTKPTKPEKPANYDPYAAYQDPDSESFAYQRKYEKYLEEKAEFAEKKAELANSEVKQDKQQRQAERAQQENRREWEQLLKNQRGYTDEQVQDFFGFVEKATTGTFQPGEVVQLYEGFSGVKADQANKQPDTTSKEEQIKKKKELKKKHAPSPASAGGAGNPGGKEPDPTNSFFQERKY